jgi:hypothetical protein
MSRKKPSNWLDQRLTILTEVMNNDTEKDWTVREVADTMRQHPTILMFQPTYGKSTAARDLAIVNKELSKKRHELAEEYIAIQLHVTDELIEDLLKQYDELDDEDAYIDLERKVRSKVAIAKAINTLFVRQANILPIDIPKKIEVAQKHSFSLEDFLELRQRAVGQLEDPTVIEGYFTAE